MIANGFAYRNNPVLEPLENIECRDAVLTYDEFDRPVPADWPDAEFIIGNPPFLGSRLLRRGLGDQYVNDLFAAYRDVISQESDLVRYWYEKARAMIVTGKTKRAGLLATQGIPGGANRKVLARIKETGDIFMAWSDEPWTVEGAAVHVAIVGFDDGSERSRTLNGEAVSSINVNLTAGVDLTTARPIATNMGICFQGANKVGPFDIDATLASRLLDMRNPHGRPNSDVLRPTVNASDITGRSRNRWIIDFGTLSEEEAALYEGPFAYVEQTVYPIRSKNKRPRRRDYWWQHGETVPGMHRALAGLTRFIVTPGIGKYRVFAWVPQGTLPDHAVIVFAREDDFFFGVLHSHVHVHELWALASGTQLESRPRYTPRTTFETFPFPSPTSAQAASIAAAARDLDVLRRGWLDPQDSKPDELKDQTLTNLYNRHPRWLDQAHDRLDRAVFDAYGWSYPLGDQELLDRLLQLNKKQADQFGGATLPGISSKVDEEEGTDGGDMES